jgi:hypothetical protein
MGVVESWKANQHDFLLSFLAYYFVFKISKLSAPLRNIDRYRRNTHTAQIHVDSFNVTKQHEIISLDVYFPFLVLSLGHGSLLAKSVL